MRRDIAEFQDMVSTMMESLGAPLQSFEDKFRSNPEYGSALITALAMATETAILVESRSSVERHAKLRAYVTSCMDRLPDLLVAAHKEE